MMVTKKLFGHHHHYVVVLLVLGEFLCLLLDEFLVLEVINLHCTANIGKSVGCYGTCCLTALLQECIHLVNLLLPLLATCTDRGKLLLKDCNKESLYLYITKATTTARCEGSRMT